MQAETRSAAEAADGTQRRRTLAAALFWGVAVVLLLGLSVGLALVFRREPPAAPATYVIGAAQDGTEVALQMGESLAVTLEGNPTTGYTWSVAAVDPTILRRLGEPEFMPTSDALGAGGMQTVRFAATGVGTTTLKLIYARPFEPDTPPLATFEVLVRVSAP